MGKHRKLKKLSFIFEVYLLNETICVLGYSEYFGVYHPQNNGQITYYVTSAVLLQYILFSEPNRHYKQCEIYHYANENNNWIMILKQ